MVFYCEQAAGFCREFGNDDENYLSSLVHMFEEALNAAAALDTPGREKAIARLNRVRDVSQYLGYGVGEAMDDMLAEHG
jgi:hypothetical protein